MPHAFLLDHHMQSLVARRALAPLRPAVRAFTSSAARAQAVPTEKPVLNKEFKIYRWVRFLLSGRSCARRTWLIGCAHRARAEPR